MIHNLVRVAQLAGQEILKEYHKEVPSGIDWKADNSPLTIADKLSHQVIARELNRLYPEIPLLSEEGANIQYQERKKWDRFFCVDPVDGTKEFIKKTGHFTVNIALIEKSSPVLGVIYVPAQNLIYYSEKNRGAFRQHGDESPAQIKADREFSDTAGLSVVASRDHAGPRVQKLFKAFPDAQTLSIGSSLKFCLVAEGKANLYYRDVPTYEWDTAAAQAIVEEAGGLVLIENGTPLTYNKENLLNPSLITVGNGGVKWIEIIRNLE